MRRAIFAMSTCTHGFAIFRYVGAWAVALTLGVTLRADLRIAAPAGMPTGQTVTAEQLWQELDRSLPPGVWVSPLEASQYEVISAKWMRRTFLPSLQRQMKTLWDKGVPGENTAGNCNGFALVCRLMLSLSAMDARAHAPAAATVIVKQDQAFGGLNATKEDHCVSYVLTDEGAWIIEVQSGVYARVSEYPNRRTIKLVSVH
jgi:hypothetical protein